jgi:hypothetical protein
MNRTVELPDETYARLLKEAETLGTTPAGWIDAHLPAPNGSPEPESSGTRADRFKGLIGGFHSGGLDAIAERCRGDSFAEYLIQKKREGHL